MSTTSIKDTAEELRWQVRYHDHRYYNLDDPRIPDQEYDDLMRRLREMEQQHPEVRDESSPTQRVGGEASADFDEVEHPEAMLSLGNCLHEEEFQEWYDRTARRLNQQNFPMLAEPKIDGLAIRLVYQQGEFRQAVTRGNGASGEDVTHNVRTIRNLPLQLNVLPGESVPEVMEVRGEVYLPRSAFMDASREREEQGEQPFANPRNAAAGTIRQLDPGLASRRGLRAWVYQFQNHGTGSHEMSLRDLTSLNLPVNPLNRVCWNPGEVVQYYRDILEQRGALDYEIDGIVVKVDHQALQDRLGATSHEPRWAVAWKFPSGRTTTRLREIRISHGRFGRLTPVAVLDPVELSGVTVQSASLHNEEDIHRKDIRPGTQVTVERAGDVIPQVTGPADPRANLLQPIFQMPQQCPTCDAPVETRENEVGHWCPNLECPALLPEQLKSFVGKRAMEIDGLGEHWCQELFDRGLVENVGDLYFVTREEWLRLARMGERLADRILRNIDESRSRPLERVLYALGIFRLGRDVSGKLADSFGSMEEISQLDRDQLEALEGIGPEIAGSVLRGFRSARVRRTIERLNQAGVNMVKNNEEEKEEMTTSKEAKRLEGLNFVVTGKLEGVTRPEAESLIRQHGGNTSSSVNGKTDYLVVGEKPGSKLDRARRLGTKVIDQEQLQAMMEEDQE